MLHNSNNLKVKLLNFDLYNYNQSMKGIPSISTKIDVKSIIAYPQLCSILSFSLQAKRKLKFINVEIY